jgi:hypothetical protein
LAAIVESLDDVNAQRNSGRRPIHPSHLRQRLEARKDHRKDFTTPRFFPHEGGKILMFTW